MKMLVGVLPSLGGYVYAAKTSPMDPGKKPFHILLYHLIFTPASNKIVLSNKIFISSQPNMLWVHKRTVPLRRL